MMVISGRVMTAWVWLTLVTLARLSMAEEPHRDAEDVLAHLEALFLDSELPEETISEGAFNPVPLWKFVEEGADQSDLGRPRFSCSKKSMSLLLRLTRHSDLRLSAGRESWLLPGSCGASVRSFGSWLSLTLPYSSCPLAVKVSNGTSLHQVKLGYFDHLLQANMTAMATCQSPAAGRHPTPPLVRCRATDVTVKLPLGSRLQSIKAVGKDGLVGTALSIKTTTDAVIVQISRLATVDSILEMMVLNSAGEMFTVLAACENPSSGSGRDRQRRAPKHKHLMDVWDGAASCVEPTTAASCVQQTTASNCLNPTTTPPSCVNPTTAPSCIIPTTPPSCVNPTTPPSCINPTTPPSCMNPTTAQSCVNPTAPPTVKPTTVASCKNTTTTSCSGIKTTPQHAGMKHPGVKFLSGLLCKWLDRSVNPVGSSMHFMFC